MVASHPKAQSVGTVLAREHGLFVGVITLALFYVYGSDWLSSMSGWVVPVALFCWLFVSMLWLAFGVVHHADGLAIKLGEPYGTLILTLSVISIEVVMISAVMLAGAQSPEIGRDMMFAVLMIVLNGLIGLCLLCGGLRHLEQVYNLQGANTFLIVLIPLSLLSLILPNFTESSDVGTYSTGQMVFAVAASAGLYCAFLVAQTLRHRGFFTAAEDEPEDDHSDFPLSSVGVHTFFLVANMLPIVLLSKSMAKVIDHQISAFAAPAALGGLVIAVLVLAPEGLAAVKSALHNRLQRSINICLGSALATIGMTVPAILLIGLATGNQVLLGLDPVESVLLMTTLLVSLVTFSSGRTSITHGIVHLVLFVAYIVMVFD